VEGQVLISETEKSFDDDTSQHLVSTHTLGAGALGLGLTCPRFTVKKSKKPRCA
jgi:hypothetical protein